MPFQVRCKSCNYLITAYNKDMLEYFMIKHKQRHKQARFSKPWKISYYDYLYYHIALKHNSAFWHQYNNLKDASSIIEALQYLTMQ